MCVIQRTNTGGCDQTQALFLDRPDQAEALKVIKSAMAFWSEQIRRAINDSLQWKGAKAGADRRRAGRTRPREPVRDFVCGA
jgi:hypothetical protein